MTDGEERARPEEAEQADEGGARRRQAANSAAVPEQGAREPKTGAGGGYQGRTDQAGSPKGGMEAADV